MDHGLVNGTAEPENISFFQDREESQRTEMHGTRHLEETAAALGRTHKLLFSEKGDGSFFRRFEENVRIIKETYRKLNSLAQQGKTLTPSEEWLVDNYYLVTEQKREIKEDFPLKFYQQLPKLENLQSNSIPRVFSLAETLAANTDSLLDGKVLKHFVMAYQKTGTPLTIGEIWALPVALRIILIESLRRICEFSENTRRQQQSANEMADRILQSKPEEVYSQAARLQKVLSANRQINSAWLVQLIRRLRNQGEIVTPILEAVEKKLRVNDSEIEQIFVIDQNQAASAVVTIGNIITSFRWLKSFDWSDFFEQVSRVDEILRQDPAGVYAKMDFPTRDSYRRKIERIARRGGKSEVEIAHRTVELSSEAKSKDETDVRAHIGFYLLDDPQETLEQEFSYQPSFSESARRALKTHPNTFYLLTISVLVTLITAFASAIVWQSGGSYFLTAITALLTLVPAFTLAVSVLNWDITKIFPATTLPKMNFSRGIPDSAQTIVVIPTMFAGLDAVREMIGRLEVHYLSNQDDNTYFALLSDFTDSDTQEKPADAPLVEFALSELSELNKRYGRTEHDGERFHLFHRKRLWSETENKWLGSERKRGKLEEFNHYLRGKTDTTFTVATLAQEECATIKNVITLDSDTKLPPGTVRRLAGIIAHPLNQPRFSGATNVIERGYAILQPRISITAESSAQSAFAQIMAGFAGLDPYTSAASDAYQDLYGAGIYTGKGLYVVDAFECALENRVPPESLLSHDLFESIFARTALVSDVEFFDDYPSVYEAHAKRLHRWIRGD